MKVELVEHTPEPDRVCGMAARACIDPHPYLADMFSDTTFEKSLESAMKSGHDSILEHASFTFCISGISRSCSHQLVRHRMASYAQQSQRYVDMTFFNYVIPKSIEANESDRKHFEEVMANLNWVYGYLVERGIPKEDARYILPNACCTNIVVTMNGRELKHFLELRLCTRAQWEIRELAEKMAEQVKSVAPIMFENLGPTCERLGYCPEARGCGRKPKKS